MSKAAARSFIGYYAVSDRVILVGLRGKPFDVCIKQVYAPICDYDELAVEEFYMDIMEAKEQCKPHDITIVTGDLDAKLDRGRVRDVVSPFELGETYEKRERWGEWCIENEQVVTNTWLRQPPRRTWIWMSPRGRSRN